MAADQPTLTQAIRARFKANVLDLWTGKNLLVQFPNAPFTPPGENDDTQQGTTSERDVWLRFTLRRGGGRQAEFGSTNNTFRAAGVLIIGIFERADTGTAKTDTLLDLVLDAFRAYGTSSPRLDFGSENNDLAPHPQDVGISDGWYQTNVVCPFFYDETA